MPSALILIADGTEEIEFTVTYDTLVRAGVKTSSSYVPEITDVLEVAAEHAPAISPPAAKCSRGVNILPDLYFDVGRSGPDTYDALIIPGGAKGAETMSKHPSVQLLIRKYIEAKKIVGMICAGSLAAATSGLPKQPLTSHPSVKVQLEKDFEYRKDSVVVSNNLVTSRGPGTAFPFALTLVELLCGREKREEISAPMVFPQGTPW